MRVKLKSGKEVSVMSEAASLSLSAHVEKFGQSSCIAVLQSHYQKLAEKELRRVEEFLSPDQLEAFSQNWRPGDASEFLRLHRKVSKLPKATKAAVAKKLLPGS